MLTVVGWKGRCCHHLPFCILWWYPACQVATGMYGGVIQHIKGQGWTEFTASVSAYPGEPHSPWPG